MKYSLLACLLLFSFSAHGALNKWVDAEGKVHYSDSPPPPDAKAQKLRISPTSGAEETEIPASSVSTTRTLAEREADWKKAEKAKEKAAQEAAQKQEAELNKQKNCAMARNNLKILENTPAISTYDANGEPALMGDAERQRNKDNALKAISQFCN